MWYTGQLTALWFLSDVPDFDVNWEDSDNQPSNFKVQETEKQKQKKTLYTKLFFSNHWGTNTTPGFISTYTVRTLVS